MESDKGNRFLGEVELAGPKKIIFLNLIKLQNLRRIMSVNDTQLAPDTLFIQIKLLQVSRS